MDIKGVQQQWQDFLVACDPKRKFHDRQRREMRRAFLSGYWSMLNTALEIAAIDCEADGAVVLGQQHSECERLIREMLREDVQGN